MDYSLRRERPSIRETNGPAFSREAEDEDPPYEEQPFLGFEPARGPYEQRAAQLRDEALAGLAEAMKHPVDEEHIIRGEN